MSNSLSSLTCEKIIPTNNKYFPLFHIETCTTLRISMDIFRCETHLKHVVLHLGSLSIVTGQVHGIPCDATLCPLWFQWYLLVIPVFFNCRAFGWDENQFLPDFLYRTAEMLNFNETNKRKLTNTVQFFKVVVDKLKNTPCFPLHGGWFCYLHHLRWRRLCFYPFLSVYLCTGYLKNLWPRLQHWEIGPKTI